MSTNRSVLTDKGPLITNAVHYGDLEVVRVDVRTRTVVFQVRTPGGPSGPETTAPLSMIRPSSEEDTGKLWKMMVDDLMRVFREVGKYPTFVKGYEVTTGEDSTGDPALYITILVAPERQYSPQTVSRWNRFSNLLLDRLIALHLQRYPYVRVGEKRRGK